MSDAAIAYAPYEVRHQATLENFEEELLVLARGFKPEIEEMIKLVEKIEQHQSNSIRAWGMKGDPFDAQRMRELLTLRRLTSLLVRVRQHRHEIRKILERRP